jgi:hypothetical protein
VLYKERCYNRKNQTTEKNEEYCECTTPGIWIDNIWDYKSIPSDIEHKSPTSIELSLQTSSMIAPNLPIDKDRYIDFMALN